NATVFATDISEKALGVARNNFERLNLAERITLLQGDLFTALAERTDLHPFHLIVSNPPYIPSNQIATLDKNVREFEPLGALDGGLDGLAPHRRILSDAPDRLIPGGRV